MNPTRIKGIPPYIPRISHKVLDQLPEFYQYLAIELHKRGKLEILDDRGMTRVLRL